MSSRKLQKESLDEIGRNLLKATRANKEEMEILLANPRLFDSIKARIQTEEQSHKNKGLFSNWANSALLNYRKTAPAFAILTVLISFAAAVILINQEFPQFAKQNIEPEISLEQPQIEYSSPVSEIKKEKPSEIKKLARHAEKIALKIEKSKSVVDKKKRNIVKPLPIVRKQSPEVFYSLGTGENWEKTGEDLQIVRAEISRSELFAIGMNLSVENEAEKIKTDLLVGSDGIARAIRFVE